MSCASARGTGSMTCSTLQRSRRSVGVHRHDHAQRQAVCRVAARPAHTAAAGARGAVHRAAAVPASPSSRRCRRRRARFPSGVNSVASYTPACSAARVERHAGLPASVRDRRGDRPRAVGRLLEQVVERAASEIDAAFERAVDADVEPALDAACRGIAPTRRTPARRASTATSANRSTRRSASATPNTPRFQFAPQLPQLPADDAASGGRPGRR